MSQQPTSAPAFLINKAKGLNDEVSAVKLEEGYAPFALNHLASGDAWERRYGRDEYWLSDGNPVEIIYPVTWDDGTINYVGLLGSIFYDITPSFSFFFKAGARLVLQAPGGQYWDCTVGFSTGLIFPTVISTPSSTPRTSDLKIAYGDNLGFQIDGGSIQLLSDFQHDGWYLDSIGTGQLGFTQFTSDVVFTYASGRSLIIEDSALNEWKFQVSDDGTFYVTTII